MAQLAPITPTTLRPIQEVAIIGAGLVGGSLALAARDAGVGVVVYDTDTDTMGKAERAGLRVASSPGGACEGADLIVLATPVDQIVATIPMIKPYIPQQAVVTDVGSVKGPAKAMLSALQSDRHTVISCHPMAGRELRGFDAADAGLFDGCVNLIFAPSGESDAQRLAHFFTRVGVGVNFAAPLELNDVATAVVSHFPQVVASLLAKVAGEAEVELIPGALAIAGPGWRDATRLAGSDYSMWGPILEANSVLVAFLLAKLAREAGDLASALQSGSLEGFAELFEGANEVHGRYLAAQKQTETLRQATRAGDREGSGEARDRWECEFAGAVVWVDNSLGYETVRTSVKEPDEHARLAAAYISHLCGGDAGGAYRAVKQGANHGEAVAAALTEVGVGVTCRKTWTADGLLVSGVVANGRFLVVA